MTNLKYGQLFLDYSNILLFKCISTISIISIISTISTFRFGFYQ
jgi:hypothetical protein